MRSRQTSIGGRVNSDGTIAGGSGFTVFRSAAGTYVLMFSDGFRLISVTAVLAVAQTDQELAIGTYSGGACTVTTFNTSAVANDQAFSFTATGLAA